MDHSRHIKKRRQSPSPIKDGIMNFEKFRRELDQIFFSAEMLRKHYIEKEDFWKFYRKLYEVQRSKNSTELPISKLNSVPFTIHFPSTEFLFSHLPPRDRDDTRVALRKSDIDDVKIIIQLYVNFLQKDKFSKLKKLRQSQKNLPIADYREEIVDAIQHNQVVIVAGDTGCGKSTQVPQYLLHAGFKKIACTQPRRIACISLSNRVSFETLDEFGSQIGYQIRFEKMKTSHTKIVFLTEGLLLRQVASDPTLSGYDVIIVDEVHERHLPADFLLGVLKCLIEVRSDVKLVLMSATINIELFQNYFEGRAPVIKVPGRLFPINVEYRPLSIEDKSSEKINPDPYIRIMQLIDHKYPASERGDVLIFLSGMSEISAIVEAAKAYAEQTRGWIILPLHSALSVSDQDKVFDYPPPGVRKCIVSTNIAETSVTIDGVRFVVDSGKVKEMTYDPVCKLQKLQESWVSKASAEQRKGRAGRTGPGIAYRLYSEKEFNEFETYTKPDIQRVPLDSMILQMISMGLKDVRKFPFIEAPPHNAIDESLKYLKKKGAITEMETVTPIGSLLSKLPVDVTLGKMLIMGSLFGLVESVLALAAALSVQCPFTNRAYRDPDVENARKPLESDHGDPITLLNAYREWLEIKFGKSRDSNSRKWCKRRGLEEQRFYEMTKLIDQFRQLLKDSGLVEAPKEELSGSERQIRLGEVKQLKGIKREYHQTAPKKRKILELNSGEDPDEEEEAESQIDIRDVEFRLRNDTEKVKALLFGASTTNFKELLVLKLILCSSLFPQVAIGDEHNSYKSGSEQLFHTRGKPFTTLHPMSYFANNPEVLQLTEADIVDIPGFQRKNPVSSKHQLLCYMTLLETTKPYLINTLRLPAAQTLFLSSNAVDTSLEFDRFIFDSWLEVRFVDTSAGMTLLKKSCEIRKQWDELLKLRIKDPSADKESENKRLRISKQIMNQLTDEIPKLMQAEMLYSVKRLLAGDIKVAYTRGCPFTPDDVTVNPLWEGYIPEECHRKGGIKLTDHVTYGCVESDAQPNPQWMCPKCESELHLSGLPKLIHWTTCTNETDKVSKTPEELERRETGYFCDICQKHLPLKGIDILRHKKKHS
ncbi:probable ATP-dependent RNA helicase DHX34 [Artemia franciscana]|uniref:ATP-dependent RNA helicase DHX34 n=1 Tax=Artemia franciscana TaxID=6661 RepID=A0AA88HUI3_ARTSF|nr:hypothetical protein QYM36_005564 [Artemia franciscana]